MAIARKCDRCGKYYDENKKYRYNLVMGTVIGLRFETLKVSTVVELICVMSVLER